MFFKSNKSEGGNEGKSEMAMVAKTSIKDEAAEAKPTPEQLEDLKKQATRSKHLQAAFGEIVTLLMRTPQFKKMPLGALEQMVVPAITTGQFTLAEAQSKKTGIVAPVAAVLWASVSEEIDRKLSDNSGEPVKLAPEDWKSGDIPWLILAAGDKRMIDATLKRVQETVLKERKLKVRVAKSDDKIEEKPSVLN